MTLDERVARHEERIKQLEKQYQEISQDIKPLDRMNTLIELQMEQNKEVSQTLKHINENLSNLNYKVSDLEQNMDSMDKRVGDIENHRVSRLQRSIDERKEMRNGIIKGVLITIIGTLILVYFGLK